MGPGRWRPGWGVVLAHLAAVLALFHGVLLQGRVFYFRDIPFYYFPGYLFLERSQAQGVWWPLWNPTSDAGARFLIAYPVDLVLVWSLGARAALALGPPLTVLIGMCGASWLARRLHCGWLGAWAAGLFFGASGFLLSSLNLFELSHGAAWAPWVLVALLALWEQGTPRRLATLGLVTALQVSTLSAEAVGQTALMGLLLLPRLGGRRDWGRLLGALLLACLLAAPCIGGAWALVQDTQRARGFGPAEALGWSVRLPLLLDIVLPRFLGDTHTFTDRGLWGQGLFPDGYPYLLALYVGPTVLLLACVAGRARWRLWMVIVLGLLLSLGAHGPVADLMSLLLRSFRSPVKFLLAPTLAVAVLAGLGVDRLGRSRAGVWMLGPGLALAALGSALGRWPSLPALTLGWLIPDLRDPRALVVAREIWPGAFLFTGIVCFGALLLVRLGPRWAPATVALAGLDLIAINGVINPTAPSTFYDLRPAVRRLVDGTRSAGTFRWFSYGATDSPGLHWEPALALRNSDVWLYHADRQALFPRTHVMEGLEAAFDEDKVGWAPQGSTLPVTERRPGRFPEHYARLRLANVRWVLSFHSLPEALVRERGRAALPEIAEPLRLYEMRDPLPRVFWVGGCEVAPDPELVRASVVGGSLDPRRVVLLEAPPPERPCSGPASGAGDASFERLDPHTIRITASGAPGLIAVLEGYDPAWRLTGAPGVPRPQRAFGRYLALFTPGGDREFRLSFRPSWRGPTLAAAVLGALLILALSLWRSPSRKPAPSGGGGLPSGLHPTS